MSDETRPVFDGGDDKIDAFESEIKQAATALFELCHKHAVPVVMALQISKTNFAHQGALYVGASPIALVAGLQNFLEEANAFRSEFTKNCGDPSCRIHADQTRH
jgi:hypothetical protein